MDSLNIRVAGQDFTIPRLNLGQLRDLSIGVSLPTPKDPADFIRVSFDRDVNVLAVALAACGKPVTQADVYSWIFSGRQELSEAVSDILTFSGLVPAKATLETLRARRDEIDALIVEAEAQEAAAAAEQAGQPGKQ